MLLQVRHLIFFNLSNESTHISVQGIFKISQATLANIGHLGIQKLPYLPTQSFGDSNLQLGDNNKNLRTIRFSTIAAALRRAHLPHPLNTVCCGKPQ